MPKPHRKRATASERPASKAQRRGAFWLKTAPLGPTAEGYAFATNGQFDVYISAALVSFAKLTGDDIGEHFTVDYVELPGSRYSAVTLERLKGPEPEIAKGDRRSLQSVMDRIEVLYEQLGDAMDEIYDIIEE